MIKVDFGGVMYAGITLKSGNDFDAFEHLLKILRRLLQSNIKVSLDGSPVTAAETAALVNG